jgi:pilus assembly protein CpaE
LARIIVIDDDEQLLRMVGLMLERGGHTTTLFSKPQEGLERVKTEKPDLLVLDVMMPAMSGHDVARQIRAHKGLENLPILILTARSQEIDRATALKSGANDYLSKPVTSQELIERVDNLLQKQASVVPPQQGILIALFGMRGGVGQTTLAVNLASALRRVSQAEVCLVDLSPSGGQAALHLRLQARSTWADFPETSELDWSILKNRLTLHQSGLRLLAAPSLPQVATEPAAGLTEAFLSLLRENVMFTVVDMPRVLGSAFTAVLEMSDIALHVLGADVVSLQTAVNLDRLLSKDGVTFRQKSYLLNYVQAESDLTQATIESKLNARVGSKINFDPNQARALSQGVPLTLTSAKSPLPVILNRLAEILWQRVVPQNVPQNKVAQA